MISQYRDMLAKAKFYKKQVIQSFIKRGYFPSDEEIEAALSDIDTRSALLETWLSAKGSLFNAKQINYMFECIYKDLNILYEVLEQILTEDFNRLKLDVEAQVVELEQKVYNLKRRMDEEINVTNFGATIFFKANGWKPETIDDTTVISLGEMDLIQGTEIALFVNINNIEASSVYFKLEAKDDSAKSFMALPHNYNEDTYIVPGNLPINRYELNMNHRLIVNGNVHILLDEVEYENDYKVMGGNTLMKVTYKDDNSVHYIPFATNSKPFQTLRDCYIEFYMLDDSFMTYDFNMAPNHTNFALNDGTISSLDTITKVFIDAPANFVCRFGLEKGEIWASCTDALIQDSKTILYTGDWSIRDFQILEFVKANKTKYNIYLILKSDKNIIDYLDCVYIKEIN